MRILVRSIAIILVAQYFISKWLRLIIWHLQEWKYDVLLWYRTRPEKPEKKVVAQWVRITSPEGDDAWIPKRCVDVPKSITYTSDNLSGKLVAEKIDTAIKWSARNNKKPAVIKLNTEQFYALRIWWQEELYTGYKKGDGYFIRNGVRIIQENYENISSNTL